LASDGGYLDEGVTGISGGSVGEVLTNDGTDIPVWATNKELTKVTKTFADIVIGTTSMDIYTLPEDAALVNVYTDITTVFDVSTAVTIGDSADDNGFQEATDWTSSTGLTDATRGAYVTSFKTMRSTSGTTSIKAYNFSTTGGSGSTFSQSLADRDENLVPPTGVTEMGQSYQTGQVLIGENVCKASFFISNASGSPTGTLRAYIRQTDGTLVATSSTTVDASTLTSSFVEHEFEFADVEILNNYMITINSDDLTSGQVNVESLNADITNGLCYQKDGGVYSQIITCAFRMNVEYACTPVTGDTQGAVDFYLQVVD
jgi:hypothetical protein